MKKVAKKRKLKYRSFIFAVGYMIIGLTLIIVLATTAYRVYDRHRELTQLQEQKETLQKEKDKLEKEVNLLNDDDYVVRYAREHYIFSKDGEQVATLPESKK